ncbi:hypothetical protein D3C72_1516250 [compost metagenome]
MSTSTRIWRDADWIVLVSRPSSLCAAAAWMKRRVTPSSSAVLPVPRFWIQNSKPPCEPSPGIDGGLTGMITASGIARSLGVISASIAGTPRSAEPRSLKLFMPTNTVPALVLYWLSMKL